MASKKRKGKGPAKKQRKLILGEGSGKEASFQTREKLQAAAKRRKRVPKGEPGAGRFAGSGSAKGARIPGGPAGSPTAKRYDRQGAVGGLKRPQRPGVTRESTREATSIAESDARGARRKDLERRYVRERVQTQTGRDPERDRPPVRVTHHAVRQAERDRRESSWRTDRGVYQTKAATQPTSQRGKSKHIPPTQMITQELAPSHRQWLEKQLNDKTSPFAKGEKANVKYSKDPSGKVTVQGKMSGGMRHRTQIYLNALQEGKSHNEALQQLQQAHQGRRPAQDTPGAQSGARDEDIKHTMEARSTRQGRKLKYEQPSYKPADLQVGVQAQHIDSINDLADMFPSMTDRDLVRLQQGQRKSAYDEIVNNAKWAQETRASNVTNGKSDGQVDNNRVVFFTTSLGSPAPSVPANSLIGQYIIRRRKNMLQREGLASPSRLQGSFPDAVRDMHIVEAATGVSLGATGEAGFYKRNGWRVGSKKSQGFGKPTPIGSSIITDSQGRPVYDENGNPRYSEGTTRRFDLGTNKDLGFRVFIG